MNKNEKIGTVQNRKASFLMEGQIVEELFALKGYYIKSKKSHQNYFSSFF